MNPTEQRDHKRVTDKLATELRELDETVASELANLERQMEQRMDSLFGAAAAGVESQIAGMRREIGALDTELLRVESLRRRFVALPIDQRLRWLLTGRTPWLVTGRTP